MAAAYQYKGYQRERMGPGTVNVCPHSHYPTKDGKWIAIACTSDKIFTRLAEAQGQPELGGAGKWGKIADRDRERIDVDNWVTRWTETFTLEDCIAACDKFEVPCGPVYSISDIFKDPHYAARENILRMYDPRVGEMAMPNVVPRLSDTPGKVEWLGPTLGQHNDEIYKGLLGFTDAEIGRLKDRGVM